MDCYPHLLKNFPKFFVIHTVKGFGIVNKAEVDVFQELSCFFNDPTDVSNLISGSSAFSKSTLNMWNFMVHVLLKLGLENFEHFFARMWDEGNCVLVWSYFGIAFLWEWNEDWFFQSCGHCWVFQICWHTECSTFTASSFRIWNSSTGIPSPPLALLKWCFLRPTWLHIPGCLALGESSHSHVYLGREDLLCIILLCAISSYYLMLLLGSYHFCP